MTSENKAAEANAALAAIRSKPHNGTTYQADDADYMLALAETQGRGLGAISPQWFRDQARLIRGTLDELDQLASEVAALRQSHENAVNEERTMRTKFHAHFGRAEALQEASERLLKEFYTDEGISTDGIEQAREAIAIRRRIKS